MIVCCNETNEVEYPNPQSYIWLSLHGMPASLKKPAERVLFTNSNAMGPHRSLLMKYGCCYCLHPPLTAPGSRQQQLISYCHCCLPPHPVNINITNELIPLHT